MRNRFISNAKAILAGALCLGAVGCGNSGVNETIAHAEIAVKASGPKTVSLWFSLGGDFQRDFQKYVVAEYEKRNPGVKIKMTFAEETGKTHVSDKLLTAIAGGNAPDIAIVDRFSIGSWAARGAIEDIGEWMKRDGVRMADYYAAASVETVFKDKIYGLPFTIDIRAMYYNKTLMKRAGLDPSKPPRTLDELDAMAEKIFSKNQNGNYERIGFVPWMGQGSLYTHGLNFGATFTKNGRFDLTEPQVEQALKWMTRYSKKYDIATVSGFNDMMAQTGMDPFWTGKVGFTFTGNWILSDLHQYEPDFDWGIAPMPTAEGVPPTSWVGGKAFIVPKGAKHREEAWKFIQFAAHKEGSRLWAGRPNGKEVITAMPSVNEELGLAEDADLNIFLDALIHAQTRPVTPVASFYWAEMYRIRDLAINGKGDPSALLKTAQKNIEAEWSRIVK